MIEKYIGNNRIVKTLIVAALAFGGVLVTLKMIFWSFFGADDTLFLMMAVRKAEGGTIFGDMWDVYSVSSILPSVLLRFYTFITHSYDGCVIFLKAVGVLFHFLVTFVLFRTLKIFIGDLFSFIISVTFFILYPRLYSFPDFTNVSLWALVLLICILVKISLQKLNENFIILASCLFSLIILSYPTMFLLLPVVLIWLNRIQGNKFRIFLKFIITSAVTAIAFLTYIQLTTGLGEALSNIGYAITADGTHSLKENLTGDSKAVSVLKSLGEIVLHLLSVFSVAGIISCLVSFLKRRKEILFSLFTESAIVLSVLPAAYKWFFCGGSYSILKGYFFSIVLLGFLIFVTNKEHVNKEEDCSLLFAFLIGFFYFVVVVISSNLPLTINLPYLQVAFVFSLVFIVRKYEKNNTRIMFSLLFVAVILIGSSGLTLQGSYLCNNILGARRLVTYGPAKGTYVDTEEEWFWFNQLNAYEENIKEGESVLIVLNNYMTPLNTFYVAKNNIISASNLVSPPSYNSNLKIYWDKYPEREPSVIAVDKTYGNMGAFSEGEWIYEYTMENYELSATSEYMDFYRIKR